jgi:membrane protease YdiL (CAAX protease family)
MFRQLPAQDRIVLGMVAFEAALGVLAALLGWIFGHPPIEKFRWSWADAGIGVLATVPALVVVGGLVHVPWRPIVRIVRFCDEVLVPLLRGASVAQLAVIAAVAGIAEEALFRGFAQMQLASGTNPWTALVIASVLFGLAHFVTLTYAVLTMLMGAYLGWLLIRFDNLLVPVVVHALYDLLVLLYVVRVRPRRGAAGAPTNADDQQRGSRAPGSDRPQAPSTAPPDDSHDALAPRRRPHREALLPLLAAVGSMRSTQHRTALATRSTPCPRVPARCGASLQAAGPTV